MVFLGSFKFLVSVLQRSLWSGGSGMLSEDIVTSSDCK